MSEMDKELREELIEWVSDGKWNPNDPNVVLETYYDGEEVNVRLAVLGREGYDLSGVKVVDFPQETDPAKQVFYLIYHREKSKFLIRFMNQ